MTHRIDLRAAWQQYEAGAPLDDVATQFGVSKTTIRRRFHLAGLPVRPRGRPRKDQERSAA